MSGQNIKYAIVLGDDDQTYVECQDCSRRFLNDLGFQCHLIHWHSFTSSRILAQNPHQTCDAMCAIRSECNSQVSKSN